MSGTLQHVEEPRLFRNIQSRIWREADQGLHGEHVRHYHVGGFEDVLPVTLGKGIFYNTIGSGTQLLMGLAVAPNPEIRETVDAVTGSSSDKLMENLRARQVLAGFRIVDLGCGMAPMFAMAARSLGAEVHTVDGEEPHNADEEMLDNHSVMDLSARGAPAVLAEETGGDFDYVTTNIIAAVPDHPQFAKPSNETLRTFAERLLKDGGFYFKGDRPPEKLMQKIG